MARDGQYRIDTNQWILYSSDTSGARLVLFDMNSKNVVEINIGGKNYILASDDNYLTNMSADFEPEMVELFSTIIGDKDVVLDIGANIGCTSILFGNLAEKVYSFEASPSTYQFLESNIARSELKNIETFNIGLGSESGETTLTYAVDNRSGGFVSDQARAGAGHITEKIVIEPLDELVHRLSIDKVDFVKLDVEGFEGQVIKGAQHLLRSNHPTVVLELNHWCLNAFQRTSIPDFFDSLRALFPVLYAVDGSTYRNLHNEHENYQVMYHHINHFRYPNIVAGFDLERLVQFEALYENCLFQD